MLEPSREGVKNCREEAKNFIMIGRCRRFSRLISLNNKLLHKSIPLVKVMGTAEFIKQIATPHIMRSFQLNTYPYLFIFILGSPQRCMSLCEYVLCTSILKSKEADLLLPFNFIFNLLRTFVLMSLFFCVRTFKCVRF